MKIKPQVEFEIETSCKRKTKMTTCYSIRIFKARLLESKLSLDYEQVFIYTEKVIT